MILSVSRRTDIPAYFAEWFMNRVREGYCLVPNPFNAKQISRVSLRPGDVDALVFWTKDFRPLLAHVDELEERGLRFYIQYTVTGYGRDLEPHVPPLPKRLEGFVAAASRLAPWRVIWRYDPIIASNRTDISFHLDRVEKIAAELDGHTDRLVISIVDIYRKTDRQFRELEKEGFQFDRSPMERDDFRGLLGKIVEIASRHGMTVQSCAEPEDLGVPGIEPGRCIDAELVQRLGGEAPARKDKGQRPACLCHQSRDIGVNDTCLHGCRYCYATRSLEIARKRRRSHDPASPMLIGRPAEDDGSDSLSKSEGQAEVKPKQTKLF